MPLLLFALLSLASFSRPAVAAADKKIDEAIASLDGLAELLSRSQPTQRCHESLTFQGIGRHLDLTFLTAPNSLHRQANLLRAVLDGVTTATSIYDRYHLLGLGKSESYPSQIHGTADALVERESLLRDEKGVFAITAHGRRYFLSLLIFHLYHGSQLRLSDELPSNESVYEMHRTNISPMRYLVLSLLYRVDGDVHGSLIVEHLIHHGARWAQHASDGYASAFYSVIGRMLARGWIEQRERSDDSLIGASYRITDVGREAFRRTFRFYRAHARGLFPVGPEAAQAPPP